MNLRRDSEGFRRLGAFFMPTAGRITHIRKLRITRLARTELPRSTPRAILFAVSLAFFAIAVIAVESSFRIFFETNDDVGMMMIAHGFGLASVPSSGILFSNVLEAKIVEFIGEPFGFTGYGIYTMSCLVVALAYIHATVAQVTRKYFSSLVVMLALGLRAVFAPQFTITAGILAVAAVIALIADPRRRSVSDLAVFAAFATASFCMRDQMFYMVMAVALPFLVKWPLKLDRQLCATLIGSAVILIFLAQWNAQIYRDPSWQAYQGMNAIRALFTDFGLANRIPLDDATLAQVGLTSLDVRLVSNWWFIGIPADRLYQLLSLAGPTSIFSLNRNHLLDWLSLYTDASTYIITILVVMTLLTVPSLRTLRAALSLLLLLSATLVISAIGREGVSRVVYPCLFLVGVANVLFCTRWKLLLAATFLVLPFEMNHFIQRAKHVLEAHDTVMESLATLDPAPVHVAWGGDFPYEVLYRPLEARHDMPKLRLFPIGGSQLAPFALAYWNGSTDGFIDQLISPSGISIFAAPLHIDLLRSFCEQKLHGRLKVQDVVSTPYFTHQHTSCRVAAAESTSNNAAASGAARQLHE